MERGMIDVAAAREFLHRHARLLERRLFEATFDYGPTSGVIAAVEAYANGDGGLGHALDPDVRAPTSQPVFVAFGLRALAAVGETPEPLVGRCCAFLMSATDKRGAVPPLLPSFLEYPRAPHWRDEPYAPDLFPAIGIAASLHELSYEHEWLARATLFCLDELDRNPPRDAHVLRQALWFLDVLGEDERFDLLAGRIAGADYFRRDPSAPEYGLSPLQLSITAERARRLFPADELDRHLDALESEQQPDGGWPATWDSGSATSHLEWSGYLTLEALGLLRAHGRLVALGAR
jgi:hypothetical protein